VLLLRGFDETFAQFLQLFVSHFTSLIGIKDTLRSFFCHEVQAEKKTSLDCTVETWLATSLRHI
jgi:hypothetical protein